MQGRRRSIAGWCAGMGLSMAATALSASADDFRYYGVFFGPSAQALQSLQSDGTPVYLRNFLSWSHALDESTRVGASFSWNWRPVLGQDWTLRDPFLKISKPRAWKHEDWSWYTDLRLHLPITEASRNRDLWAGVQSFNSFDWETPYGGAGIYASVRRNVLGTQGEGDEWEFYVAPHAQWQALSTLSLGALIEWDGGTPFGEDSRVIYSDGWNLQPGLSWDPTPQLNLSPFVNLPLWQDPESSPGASLGVTLSWKIGG